MRVRRLNRLEYENTVRDLLDIDAPLRDLLPEDDLRDGFGNQAGALSISPVHGHAHNKLQCKLRGEDLIFSVRLAAGGGFQHGRHLAFNRPYLDEVKQELNAAPDSKFNPDKKIPLMGQDQQPLCNLFTSMLRKGGLAIDRFSSATGPLEGLA